MSEPLSRKETIAVVDDDPITRQILRAWLAAAGHAVVEITSGAEALVRAGEFSVMCLDLGLDDMKGLDVIGRLSAVVPDLTILVVTGNSNIETVVEVMRAGAYDYVTKPLDRERFIAALSRALERVELLSRVREMARRDPLVFNEIIGVTPAIRELNTQITNVLDTDIAVCINGESGTGKELVARAIHVHGRRRKGPFVAVNCASIPTSLQESELFGHERGAFTGALATHRGRFEQAHGGTLFLDEIGEMGLPTQAILLRTLESKTIRRVGAVGDIPVNVRVVCATHRDLQAEVRAGRFRDDLYFRLVVYPIAVPPLRDRLADVPLLVAHIIRDLKADVGREVAAVSPEVLDALMRHDWPGNVRELRNVVHRAMVACKGDTIELSDLQPSIRDQAAPVPPSMPSSLVDGDARGGEVPTLREIEREAIAKALAAANGNVTKAAKMLGLGRATLYRRIAELQLTVHRAQ